MHEPPIITLDGPSGSGKGTLGVRLAEALGWHFLDSGAVYRALALLALRKRIECNDETTLAQLAKNLDLKFTKEVVLEGKTVTHLIRSEECSQTASKIAVFTKVRAALLERQRAFCRMPGLVADGRDMGTVVFPEARVKVYLEASAETRAKRRYLQLKDTEHSVTLENLLDEIRKRDLRDKHRANSPLKPSEAAVVIDTTQLGIEEAFECIMQHVKRNLY